MCLEYIYTGCLQKYSARFLRGKMGKRRDISQSNATRKLDNEKFEKFSLVQSPVKSKHSCLLLGRVNLSTLHPFYGRLLWIKKPLFDPHYLKLDPMASRIVYQTASRHIKSPLTRA